MRLIDAESLKELFPDNGEGSWTYNATVKAYIDAQPTIQPERKDAIEKAVAVEVISGELMSRFDISATYAYEVAESAINRIEMMAKEIGKE